MKLNRKHINALDIAIHKVLDARDKSYNGDEQHMLGLNAQRLRQLRILLIECIVNPTFDLTVLFHEGIKEDTNLAKGLRALTGNCETETP